MAQAKTYERRFQSKVRAEKYAKRFERGSRKRIDTREQPIYQQFEVEVVTGGFRVAQMVPIRPVWVSENYLVLEKA